VDSDLYEDAHLHDNKIKIQNLKQVIYCI